MEENCSGLGNMCGSAQYLSIHCYGSSLNLVDFYVVNPGLPFTSAINAQKCRKGVGVSVHYYQYKQHPWGCFSIESRWYTFGNTHEDSKHILFNMGCTRTATRTAKWQQTTQKVLLKDFLAILEMNQEIQEELQHLKQQIETFLSQFQMTGR